MKPDLDHDAVIADGEADREPAIEVGSSYRVWWFLALAGGSVCLAAGGVLLWLARANGGLPTLFAAAVLGAVTAFAAVSIAARRLAVRITPEGFIVCDRHGERIFSDEQVICASDYSTANFRNGERTATTRTFDLWVEGQQGPERFTMVNRIALGQDDPLDLLIERILEHLYDRAQAALDAREPFDGEGWSVHDGELLVLRKRVTDSVPLAELAAAEVFDDELCVWTHGQDKPAARISVRSANASVLHRLLRERITEPGEPTVPDGGSRLGRILFERRPTRTEQSLLWLMPMLAPLTFWVAIAIGIGGNGAERVILALVIALGILCVWLLLLWQTVWLRCHEHGVSRRWLWWEQRVTYSGIKSFTYRAVPQYVKGVYSGTTFTLTFVADTGPRPVTLSYSRTLRNADNELERLRDRVSRAIAARMSEQYFQGGPVAWTDGLRFLPEGLEYRAPGWFSRQAPVMLRYDEIVHTEVSSGVFYAWVNRRAKPAIKEQTGQPNFFPGKLFLSRLLTMQPADRASGR